MDEHEALTIADVARLLRISPSYAYKLARQGKLPGAVRLGRRWVVLRRLLEEGLGLPPGYFEPGGKHDDD